MVTKFDIGDEVVIKGVVDSIVKLSGGIYYGIKDKDEKIIVAEESSLLKAESTTNDFPCKIGDTFYYVDTLLFKNITEVVCKGFREIGSTIYLLGSDGSSYYIGAVCFDKAEAEERLNGLTDKEVKKINEEIKELK